MDRLKGDGGKLLRTGALLAAALLAAAAGIFVGRKTLDEYAAPLNTDPVTVETVTGLARLPDGAYSYVVSDGAIGIDNIGRGHVLVKKSRFPTGTTYSFYRHLHV